MSVSYSISPTSSKRPSAAEEALGLHAAADALSVHANALGCPSSVHHVSASAKAQPATNRFKVQGNFLLDLPARSFSRWTSRKNSEDPSLAISYLSCYPSHAHSNVASKSTSFAASLPHGQAQAVLDLAPVPASAPASSASLLLSSFPTAPTEALQADLSAAQARNGLRMATVGLLSLFRHSDAGFAYDESRCNPKRVLTKPSKPMHNGGMDNEHHDYILYVGDYFGNEEGRRFAILDLLGHGTFGQVVKCQNVKTKEVVAIKIIKNQTAYFNQSMMEVTILELLNQKFDSSDLYHITRMKDTFIYKKHLCIVFELLSLNLFELIKQNHFKGFSHQLVRIFLNQILEALCLLNEAKIVHCDLKPENILLKSMDSPEIKVIDFGSACHEQHTVYTYIQSRFYRSPEVLFGLPYSSSIDLWSLGCIAAELFLGLPIFPGSSNYDQAFRIVEALGMPPSHMLEVGKSAHVYFEKTAIDMDGRQHWRLKSREAYCRENNVTEKPSKKYFNATKLDDIVRTYPMSKSKANSPAELELEKKNRLCLLDFLKGLLKMNPIERWSPQQAKLHPYLTGELWTEPFFPPGAYHPVPRLLRDASAHAMEVDGDDGAGGERASEEPATRLTEGPAHIKRVPISSTGQRPRASTINSQLYNVPPQIQRLAAATSSYGASGPPGGASSLRRGSSSSHVRSISDAEDGPAMLPTMAQASASGVATGSAPLDASIYSLQEDACHRQLPFSLGAVNATGYFALNDPSHAHLHLHAHHPHHQRLHRAAEQSERAPAPPSAAHRAIQLTHSVQQRRVSNPPAFPFLGQPQYQTMPPSTGPCHGQPTLPQQGGHLAAAGQAAGRFGSPGLAQSTGSPLRRGSQSSQLSPSAAAANGLVSRKYSQTQASQLSPTMAGAQGGSGMPLSSMWRRGSQSMMMNGQPSMAASYYPAGYPQQHWPSMPSFYSPQITKPSDPMTIDNGLARPDAGSPLATSAPNSYYARGSAGSRFDAKNSLSLAEEPEEEAQSNQWERRKK